MRERNSTSLTNENKLENILDIGDKNTTSLTNRTTLLKNKRKKVKSDGFL